MNNLWILESNEGQGWKVIFCKTKPAGGRKNGNWTLLKDGLTGDEAIEYRNKISTTKIVHLRKEKCDFKITRKPDHSIPDPPEFGFLGNPYFVSEYGREGCIKKFKEYFYNRIQEDIEFKKAVEKLKGKTLGCFCKPLDCHGDIVKEYLDE